MEVLWNSEALENEADQGRWRGPYLEQRIVEDAWGSEIQYAYPSEEMGEDYYDLISFGPDREEGTDDDITNHDRLRDEEGDIDLEDFSSADVGSP